MINQTRLATCVAAIVALSSCASNSQLSTPPIEVSFQSEQARSQTSQFVVLPSRTYLFDANRKRNEIEGVPCQIKGNGFQVTYTTPANVRLPTYGIETADLEMTCTWEDERRFQPLHVRNLTLESIQSSGVHGGLVGVVVTAGIAAGRGNRPDDRYSYRLPEMELNERPPRR